MSPALRSLHRRRLLTAAALSPLSPLATLSLAGTARPGEARLVLVILRGGLDGLAAVPVPGDPAFAAARGALADFSEPALPLDGPFALHPALAQLHRLYGQGELAVVHATGLPYRERSHFEAQQLLESGGHRPHQLATGWLGRALAGSRGQAIAMQSAVPLVLRGPAEVHTWAPSVLPEPAPDLLARLTQLYAADPALAQALSRARELRAQGVPMVPAEAGMSAGSSGGTMSGAAGGSGRSGAADRPGFSGAADLPGMSGAAGGPAKPGVATAAAMPAPAASALPGAVPRPPLIHTLARQASEFLARPGGPKVAVLEMGGWDTHANQTLPQGALTTNMRVLDGAMAALRDGLKAKRLWSDSVVLVVTEFGREIAMNGTQGTDHGSGGMALLLGGAVRGGQVIADWPGLAARDRFEGRDLRITTDLRSVFKTVLRDHLQVASAVIEGDALPGSSALPVLPLLRG